MKTLSGFISLINSMIVPINVFIGLITSPFLFLQEDLTQWVGRKTRRSFSISCENEVHHCPKQTVNEEQCVLVSFIIYWRVGFAQAVNANAASSLPAPCNVGCPAVAVDGLH